MLRNRSGLNAHRKGFTSMRVSMKRPFLAVMLALTVLAIPPLFDGAHARSLGESSQIVVGPPPNNCVGLGLFAFPVSPKQGDVVNVFVSVMNITDKDASYVVVTDIVQGSTTVVAHDERVVAVPAQSTGNFQITLPTSAATPAGTYAVVAQSYPGDSLPACANCVCSSAFTRFNLGCNTNDCTPQRGIFE